MKLGHAVTLIAAGACALGAASFAASQGRPKKSTAGGAIRIQSPRSNKAGTIKGDLNPRATLREIEEAHSRRLATHRGTEIAPHPEARGDELVTQRRIAEVFGAQDPAADANRIAHFSWMDDPEVRCMGWHGTIQEVTKGVGGLLVRVRVAPILVSARVPSLFTTDYVVETYELRDGKLSLRNVEAPPAGTLKMVFTD